MLRSRRVFGHAGEIEYRPRSPVRGAPGLGGIFCWSGYSGAIEAAARTGNGSEACLGECIPLI
jgi:hypothetical protein